MEDLVEELTLLLMKPYRYLAEILHTDIDPLILAYIILAPLAVLAIVLRLLRFRRLSKIIAVATIMLSMPPLLVTIGFIIDIII